MATLARRKERSANTWPGFVDALSALLMVLMFIVMVFVIAQFFDQAISGRDQSEASSLRLEELANVLSLERQSNKDLGQLARLSGELRASIRSRDTLNTALRDATGRIETLETTWRTKIRNLPWPWRHPLSRR